MEPVPRVHFQWRQPQHTFPSQTPQQRLTTETQLAHLGEIRHFDQRFGNFGKIDIPVVFHVLTIGQVERKVRPATGSAVHCDESPFLVQPIRVLANNGAVVRDPFRGEFSNFVLWSSFQIVRHDLVVGSEGLDSDVIILQASYGFHPAVWLVGVQD